MDVEALIERVRLALPEATFKERDGEVFIDLRLATARIRDGKIHYVSNAGGAEDETALRRAISGQ